MDEGIEYKLKKESLIHSDYESFMNSVKSKRYTYNRMQRLLTNLLLNLTKDDAKKLFNIEFIRLLGFTKSGRQYLNEIKGRTMIPISSKFTEGSIQLDFELKATSVYSLALPKNEASLLIKKEIRSIPIRK
jgi:predicted nucleotidyltransferase